MKTRAQTQPSDLKSIVQNGRKGRRFRRWLWIGGPILLVAIVAAILLGKGNGGAPEQAFLTEPLRRGDISLSITATGNLEPTNQIIVGSELSGTVKAVFVDINDRVTKGQPLAQLDPARLQHQILSSRASLNSARSRVAQAEATVKEREADLRRQRELHRLSGGRAPSQSTLDTAEAGLLRAEADLLSARAAVEEAEARLGIDESDLEKALIKSPVDGIVLTRSVDPGQTVAASFNAPELFVIAEKLERMNLKIKVAEADIGRVEVGQRATFTVDAWPTRSYEASVVRVAYGSALTNNVVTYETELEVANDDLSLRPGMTATADIQVAQSRGVLLAPAAALRFNPPAPPAKQEKRSFTQRMLPWGNFRRGSPPPMGERLPPGSGRIWIKDPQGPPRAVVVETGLSDGRSVEVSAEGLAEGAPVILRATAPAQ